jgi:hypothetical protein
MRDVAQLSARAGTTLVLASTMEPTLDNGNGKPDHAALYRGALESIRAEGVEMLVGGAYALRQYAGVIRDTKDLDVFVRPKDVSRTLAALEKAGFRTDVPYPHWLAKGFAQDRFIDVIFCSGNGLCTVDDEWFENGVAADVLGMDARLVPIEEMIWTKSFVMERERFDGADVAHLLLASGEQIHWPRLLERFGDNWRVLFAHLALFGFIYPHARDTIPGWVLQELSERLQMEPSSAAALRVCRGTLLSREQFLRDVRDEGYLDARLQPLGSLTTSELAPWSAEVEGR